LPLEQLEADMRYIFRHFPNANVALHDPNFAVKFEQVFDVLETVPNRRRMRYTMEASLAGLRGNRLERLKRLGDFYILPGVESWTAYSNKVGAGSAGSPRLKLDHVVEQLSVVRRYVIGIQANFIFGLDLDSGNEPIELTSEFASRAPFVMPNINIPVPFGNTPLYERYFSENRLLTSMPFSFYHLPYLVFLLKNYRTVEFYEKLIALFSHISSAGMLADRLKSAPSPLTAGFNLAKTLGNRQMVGRFREIRDLLTTDRQFRAFHEHETDVLPEFYHRRYEQLLGPYAGLMSREDRKPVLVTNQKKSNTSLNQPTAIPAQNQTAKVPLNRNSTLKRS
jgi:hypothetical protein